MIPGEKLRLTLEMREDGGLRVWSDDLPGLVLSAPNPDAVMRDVWPAICVLHDYPADRRARAESGTPGDET